MPLWPTADTFRAEMARYRITRSEICDQIGMHPSLLTQYLNERRPLSEWAAHNIGTGINTVIGKTLFAVDPDEPIRTPPPGRQPNSGYVQIIPVEYVVPAKKSKRIPRWLWRIKTKQKKR